MGEIQKEVVEHLSEIRRSHRGICERSRQHRLLDCSGRQNLMAEIQRYQRRLRRKFTVREDRFRGFRIALLEYQAQSTRHKVKNRR